MGDPGQRGLRAATVLALVLAFARPAAADVDLTGRWRFEVSLSGNHLLTAFGDFTQSGTDLSVVFIGNAPNALAGTIDPSTGVFSLTGPPFTAVGAPPGPDEFFNGTAALDGASLTGQGNTCIYEPGLGWGCATFDVSGARGASSTCGDGVLDPGETCDLGAANGGACCTPVCTLVDPDGDGVCSQNDDCPTVFNPSQSDLDGDGVGDACDVGPMSLRSGRIAAARDGTANAVSAAGTFVGWFAVPVGLHVRHGEAFDLDVGALPSWAAKRCTSTATRIRCKSPDRMLSLVLTALGASPTIVDFRLTVKRPPATGPFIGPISVLLQEPDGLHVGVLSSCTTSASGAVRCR